MKLLNTSASDQSLTDRLEERISTFIPINAQGKTEHIGKSTVDSIHFVLVLTAVKARAHVFFSVLYLFSVTKAGVSHLACLKYIFGATLLSRGKEKVLIFF